MQPLGWFRLNNASGVWLAFFALACQLVLTFGHVHFTSAGALSAALANAAAPAVDRAAAPAPPTQPAPAGLSRDFCAVCNNIGLANALVLPAPPGLVLPASKAAYLQQPLTSVEPASQRHFHFSARGPPAA
jgi:hypothetical protein